MARETGEPGQLYQRVDTDFSVFEELQAWLPVARFLGEGWDRTLGSESARLATALKELEQEMDCSGERAKIPVSKLAETEGSLRIQGYQLRRLLLECGMDCNQSWNLSDISEALLVAAGGQKIMEQVSVLPDEDRFCLNHADLHRQLDLGQEWLDGLLRIPKRFRDRTENLLLSREGEEALPRLFALRDNLAQALAQFEAGYQTLDRSFSFQGHVWFSNDQQAGEQPEKPLSREDVDLSLHVSRSEEALEALQRGDLDPEIYYRTVRSEAASAGLEPWIICLEQGKLLPDQLKTARQGAMLETQAAGLFERSDFLGKVNGRWLETVARGFREQDREARVLMRKHVRQKVLSRTLPEGSGGLSTKDMTELTLIQKLATMKRPRMSIRRILTQAGDAVQALKPCFMMGPLGVARYLEPGKLAFDLVVMDEASQMPPAEALGAIARCKRNGGTVVVVGDDRQMPPSGIFRQINRAEDDDDEDGEPTATESILELCQPVCTSRRLRWHYRSRHDSLIRFSNHRFYENSLICFPSASSDTSHGIQWKPVLNAVFSNKTNHQEAAAIVDYLFDMLACNGDSTEPPGIGVVTMNAKQAELVEEMFDNRLLDQAEDAEQVRNAVNALEKNGSPLFIKNLENVQGDERDIILLAMTYGPNEKGQLHQRFGPLGGKDGARRLNVAITRARTGMVVFSSFEPEKLRLPDSESRASIAALQDFLFFARDGKIREHGKTTERDPDSEFEIAVGRVLENAGWNVTYQLGVSPYFIDLAIQDPDNPDRHILAVECDGAAYHSHKSARDRDRLRQERLEAMGWQVYRIWSTDWFQNQTAASERLLRAAANALKLARGE